MNGAGEICLGDEYPKAMYQDGGEDLIDGKPVRTVTVSDATEEEVLRLEGWRLRIVPNPLDHDLDGKSDGSMPRRARPLKGAIDAQ